jgi:hypothetical protein
MFVLASTIHAQSDRKIVCPFPGDLQEGGVAAELMMKLAAWLHTPPYSGGDRLVALQNDDGGWDWPLDNGDPTTSSPPNTIGPIGMGLAHAYLNTGDIDMLTALQNAGTFLLGKTNNFSPSDGYLAVQLDCVLGGSTYSDHLMTNYYGPLAAGTYDRNGAGTLYDTAGYVNMIRTARASQGIPNLAAWDIGMGLVAAAMIGADTAAWIAGVKAEIDELNGNSYYDVIGLAGAVYGLAIVGEDFDPTAGEHSSATSLADLAFILSGYQLATGGFTWNMYFLGEGEFNETIQETAYALLALNEFDRSTYLANITAAADYMRSVQLGSGGWENYVGSVSGENNEVTGEALWGISAAYPIVLEYTGFEGLKAINETVSLQASLVSPLTGPLDGRQVDFMYDGTSIGDGMTDVSGIASSSHPFPDAGVYEVYALFKCIQSDSVLIVIHDPSVGFITGGGSIYSTDGSFPANPTLEGKATFGFVAKYKKGANTPDGNTQFQFKVADLSFHSTSYDWLVVAGAKAKFKGTGMINGMGNYGFMITAVDGDLLGEPGPDAFRIKITDGDIVVYDNKMGASDADYAATELSGGSIVIHTDKKTK